MIDHPKNLTEQLLNLAERIAIEMRVLLNTINTKLNKDKWNELKALAFKDSVDFSTDSDPLDYDPVEFFNRIYEAEE
jgi:hypothetical protein